MCIRTSRRCSSTGSSSELQSVAYRSTPQPPLAIQSGYSIACDRDMQVFKGKDWEEYRSIERYSKNITSESSPCWWNRSTLNGEKPPASPNPTSYPPHPNPRPNPAPTLSLPATQRHPNLSHRPRLDPPPHLRVHLLVRRLLLRDPAAARRTRPHPARRPLAQPRGLTLGALLHLHICAVAAAGVPHQLVLQPLVGGQRGVERGRERVLLAGAQGGAAAAGGGRRETEGPPAEVAEGVPADADGVCAGGGGAAA